MMTVNVNGVEYNGFISVSLEGYIDQLCDQFTIKCTSDQYKAFPIPRGAPVEIYADETKVFTGFAEKVSGSDSHDDHSREIRGRDKTKVILKTDMPPSLTFKGPIGLIEIMERTLKKAGIALNVIDLTGGLDDFTKKEIMTADIGSSMWDFWMTLAEKRQVLISKDWDSNIVVFNPNTNRYNKTITHLFNDDDAQNNVISATFDFDDSDRRAEYNVRSQENVSVAREERPPAEGAVWEPPVDDSLENEETFRIRQAALLAEPGSELGRVLNEKLDEVQTELEKKPKTKRTRTIGIAYDTAITDGSKMYEKAERSSDNDECERIAKWRANQARVASIAYNCKVPGLIADSEPYQSGYIMDVISEPASIDSSMMINSVTLTSDRSGEDADEYSSLGFTIPDAYSSDGTPTDTQIRVGNIGENWSEGEFQ